jgi:predicted nucleotidyltransferase
MMKKTRELASMEDQQAIAEVFDKYPDILAAYLFGSTAARKSHEESDLDLAIVPRTESLRKRKLEILADLARIGFCCVDLVFLDTNDIVLKYEALRPNKLIYHTEEFDHGSFYSKVVRQYLDFLPYLKVQREAYKRRILSG